MPITPSGKAKEYFAGRAVPVEPEPEPMATPRGPVGTDREMYADRVIALPPESKDELIKDYFETLTTDEIEAALAEYETEEVEEELTPPEAAMPMPESVTPIREPVAGGMV